MIHRLDDGTAWKQVSDRIEHVYGGRPEARIYGDEVLYLSVDRVSGVVEVVQVGEGRPVPPG